LIQSLAKSHKEKGPKTFSLPTPWIQAAAAFLRASGEVDISLSIIPISVFFVEGEDFLITLGADLRSLTKSVQRSILPRLFRLLA